MKKSVKKNFIYNIIYQILILIIPLLCAPYLARTLGSDGIGTYSYAYSIVYYFMIFTLLGVENYGSRMIAKNSNDIKKKSRTFFEIYAFQCLCGSLLLIFYLLFCIFLNFQSKNVFLVETFFIVSALFDINWFFFGIEKFKATITRNIVVKLLSLVLIFVFVKGPNDLIKYAFIMSFSTFLSQILLFPFLKGEIVFVRIHLSDLKKHIIPNLKLFIPVIAVSIFKMIDKVMIGSFSTMNEVGFYENAEKIIKVPISLISALGVVMMPRITNLLANNDSEKVRLYIDKSIKFINFLTFPMMFGIISISSLFIPFFYGSDFNKSSSVLIYLSLTIPILGWANVIRTQYLIPKEKDKTYIYSAIAGAVINVFINFLFIPKYGAIGACYGTVLSEIIVAFIQSFSVRKELPLIGYLKSAIIPFITSICMYLSIYFIYIDQFSVFINILLKVIIGALLYALFNIKYIISLVKKN